MGRIPYPTELTDDDWQRLEPLLPDARTPGRPRQHSGRDSLKAIFSVLRTGCQWRCLPHAMPNWATVDHYFRRGRKAQVWARRPPRVRAPLRVPLGREAPPRGGLIDRQSVKTTGGGGDRGDDGAKKSQGRTRPLLVDTQGLGRTVTVHPAGVMDRDGVALFLPPAPIKAVWPRLTSVWLDAAYNGQDKGPEGIERPLGWRTQVVKPPPRRALVAAHVEPTPRPAFTVLPRRWVVERPLAWLGQNRRLSKDDER